MRGQASAHALAGAVMEPLMLAPSIHCCRIDGFMFLDLAADRYFKLPPALEAAFAQWAAGAALDTEPAMRLRQAGILAPAADAASAPSRWRPPQAPAPTRSLLEDNPGGAGARAPLAPVAAWLFAMTIACRAGGLARLVERLSRRGKLPEDGTEALAQGFLAARPSIPLEPLCLRDSLALAFWLRRRGAGCTFVIGVKRPFAAHAWIQRGELVLNDFVDRVREFTPILVV